MKQTIPIFRLAKKYLNPSENTARITTTPSIIAGAAIAVAGVAIGSKKIIIVGSLMSAGNLLFLKSRTGK